ncbi:MAG: glycosyltransferase family 2 protein [Microbacter sp.]
MNVIQSDKLIQNPFVSIIIPSYNRADKVSETIDSILNQTCNFDFEIVIGDDCSTDNAREVLIQYQKKYPEKIILLFHESNVGLAANWATCVKMCRGKYLSNCDNDDFWHNPNKLQLQVDFLESHPDYGVIHSDYRTLNRKTGIIHEIIVHNYQHTTPLHQFIFNGKFKFCNATMMYRTELINKYVNLDDYIKYQFTLQDWGTWVILAKYTNFYCLPVSTATLCLETDSITRPKSYKEIETRLSKEKQLYKYLCDLFPEDFPYIEKDYDIYIHKVLLNSAYLKSDYKSAKQFAIQLQALGYKNIKVFCSLNPISFYIFLLLKKTRSKN